MKPFGNKQTVDFKAFPDCIVDTPYILF